MAQLGVGIIGCGNISTTYLTFAPVFKSLKLVAVADINMDSARQKAEEYGVRADTVDDLLKASDVDVILALRRSKTCAPRKYAYLFTTTDVDDLITIALFDGVDRHPCKRYSFKRVVPPGLGGLRGGWLQRSPG